MAIAANEDTFQQAVIERSSVLPVIVDFWAAWCGPCRALAPVLEKCVDEAKGAVELVKVDTDACQALASRYNIRGIPAVKAFLHGKEVGEFVGVRDAAFIAQWLRTLAPSEHARALDAAQDEAALRALLDNAEVGENAALRLVEMLLDAGRAEEALALLPRVSSPEVREGLRQRAELLSSARPVSEVQELQRRAQASPRDAEALWTLAATRYASGELEAALVAWLELVAKNRKFRDDGARKAMLLVFAQLGSDHPLTEEYRRRLMIAL